MRASELLCWVRNLLEDELVWSQGATARDFEGNETVPVGPGPVARVSLEGALLFCTQHLKGRAAAATVRAQARECLNALTPEWLSYEGYNDLADHHSVMLLIDDATSLAMSEEAADVPR